MGKEELQDYLKIKKQSHVIENKKDKLRKRKLKNKKLEETYY